MGCPWGNAPLKQMSKGNKAWKWATERGAPEPEVDGHDDYYGVRSEEEAEHEVDEYHPGHDPNGPHDLGYYDEDGPHSAYDGEEDDEYDDDEYYDDDDNAVPGIVVPGPFF